MNKPDLEKATKKELVEYIAYQESLLSGISALQQQINRTCDILSSDLEKIGSGKTDELIILSLDDNILKKLMFTIKNKDSLLGKSSSAVSKAKTAEEPESVEIEKPAEITGNPFELVSAKVKQKINGTAK
jgi:hypothetical protein